MPNRIRAEKPDCEGILFRIENDDVDDVLEGGADVRLDSVAPQIADPSVFGKSQLPADSKAYDVRTNDPKSQARVLHIPSEGKIVVHTCSGRVMEYSGSLSGCILKAYNDGAFRA